MALLAEQVLQASLEIQALLAAQAHQEIQLTPARRVLLALPVLKAIEARLAGQDPWACRAPTALQVLLDSEAGWAIPAILG